MEIRVYVKFAILRSNPWRQFIELLEICGKDTDIHKKKKKKKITEPSHNFYSIYNNNAFLSEA